MLYPLESAPPRLSQRAAERYAQVSAVAGARRQPIKWRGVRRKG